MIKPSTSYEAYCMECNGGGKSLGKSSKKLASRTAVSHMKTYGHKVEIHYS